LGGVIGGKEAADVEEGDAAVAGTAFGEGDGLFWVGFGFFAFAGAVVDRVALVPFWVAEAGHVGGLGGSGGVGERWSARRGALFVLVLGAVAHVVEHVVVVAEPLLQDGGSASRACVVLAFAGRIVAVGPVLCFLEPAISQERSQDDGVGYGGRAEYLAGRPHGAVLLNAFVRDDGRNSVGGDGNQNGGKTEQQDEPDLGRELEVRFDDHRERKDDEEDVGDDVGGTHGDKLRICLPTMWSRIWHHLPIMVKGMAFGKSCDEHGDEGNDQEGPNGAQDRLGTFGPEAREEAFQVLGDGKLCDPDASRGQSGFCGL